MDHKTAVQRGVYFLTVLYYIYPLHIYLENNRAITTDCPPLHIAFDRSQTGTSLVAERNSVTTKLHALSNGFVTFLIP